MQKNFGGLTDQQLLPDYIDNNTLDLELDTPIYRIFNEERFYQMLEGQQLTLVHTSSWKDPFENFLLAARWELLDGTPVNIKKIRNQYYGQCWTLRRECDGLWRNYRGSRVDETAPEPCAFKVATTVRKLMEQFYNLSNRFHQLSYFVGKVNYCSDNDINNYFTQPEKMNTSAQMANLRYPQTMLIKREAFSYEQEVRLIYSDNPENSAQVAEDSSPLYQVSIDANKLFDFIELDPWMSTKVREAAEKRIKAAGFTGSIIQSTLYVNPNFVVRVAL